MDVREYTEVVPERAAGRGGSRGTTRGSPLAWAATTAARSASCRWSAARSGRGPLGDVLAEVQGLAARGVVEVTLLGPEREHLRPRPDRSGLRRAGRGSASCSGRSRRGRHPPRPVHQPASPRLHRRRGRGHGRVRARSASTSTSRCSRARTGSSARCAARTGRERYLSWLDRIRAGDPRHRRHHRRHRGLPGRDRGGLRGDAATWSTPARFDAAFTFQYSPRPGTVAADLRRPGPEGGRPGAVRPAGGAPGAISLERNRALVGRTVEVLVEGDGPQGRTCAARTRTNKLVHAAGRPAARPFADVA